MTARESRTGKAPPAPLISVIVPVLNEADNLAPLIAEIEAAAARQPIGEIIYVDDGSSDDSLAILRRLIAEVPRLRVVRHQRPLGQSAAFLSGARAASGGCWC